jgi:hypothetical protein
LNQPKLYNYVGPDSIRVKSVGRPAGRAIASSKDLFRWIAETNPSRAQDGRTAATFVIDPEGCLRLADRRSEHVVCSGGDAVRSAGEMFFRVASEGIGLEEVSNHSTGFCPEPESWREVEAALDRLAIDHPGQFTTLVVFRRCPTCGERSIVKDDWFECQLCGGELPREWNFA